MNLLFLKSKYRFNNYKSINVDKNYNRNGETLKIKIRLKEIFLMTLTIFFVFNCRFFFKKLIDDNYIVKEKFEKRKIQQMSYDYMIYCISEKDQLNDIKKLSLF